LKTSWKIKVRVGLACALISLALAAQSAQAAGGGTLDPNFVNRESVDAKTKQSRFEGWVELRPQHSVFVDYLRPARGQQVAILLNGLTYRTGVWQSYVDELKGQGLGILRYDPKGHGKTMVRDGYPTAAIDYVEQVRDLKLLMDHLGIRSAHLVTLSYGSAFGAAFATQYPRRVSSLILMAPYIAPLEDQDMMIKAQIAQTRLAFPLNPASDDELYDFFLRQTVYSTYPMAEPIVLEHPFKLESTFRLVQGVRRLKVLDIASRLPDGKAHLVLARQDQYVQNHVHDNFWAKVPKSKRASRLYIQGSEHKVPEAVPRFAAWWTRLIIEGDARLSGDRTFEGGPWMGGALTGAGRTAVHIQMP
jgi:pimeloyl-ACP methyl ester carboxylesterase